MLTYSFTAHDSDGNTYEILVLGGGHRDVSDLNSRSREIRPKSLKLGTSDGLEVNRISKGRYEILIDNKN